MKLKKFLCLALTIILSQSLLIGCGDKDKNKNKNQEKDVYTGSIMLQMRNVESLNPIMVENQSVRDALSLCYEPLFRINEKVEPHGIIAESWKISDDSKTVIITLKDAIKWHDGKTLTAADVVYTINEIRSSSSIYSFCVDYIENAEAIDAKTVRLTLSRPYAQIVYSLYFPVIPSHIENIDEKIVGTGPFCMEKYLPSSELQLKSFDLWHGGDVKAPKAIIAIVRDNDTAASAFNTNVINAITGSSYDLSSNAIKSGLRSKKYPSKEYEFIAFNHKRKLFSSAAVRGAISMAVNRNEIVTECYNEFATAANVPLHPLSGKTAPSSTFAEYNVEAALEMLFYEGYCVNEKTGLLQDSDGGKVEFTLLVNKENINRSKCGEFLAAQLMKVGITVNVRELDFEDYTKAIEEGSFDAYIGGVKLGNIYDFEFLLSSGGKLNNYDFNDKNMDLALANIASAPTEASLENAILNFEEIFMREQPVCGLAFCSDVLITAENVNGKLSPSVDFPYANADKWSIK